MRTPHLWSIVGILRREGRKHAIVVGRKLIRILVVDTRITEAGEVDC